MNISHDHDAHVALCAHMNTQPFVEKTSTYNCGSYSTDPEELLIELGQVACITVADENIPKVYHAINKWCEKNDVYYSVSCDMAEEEDCTDVSVSLTTQKETCPLRFCRCVENYHDVFQRYETVNADTTENVDLSKINENVHEDEVFMQHLCVEAISGESRICGFPASLGFLFEDVEDALDEDYVHYPECNLCLPPSGFNNEEIHKFLLDNVDWDQVNQN